MLYLAPDDHELGYFGDDEVVECSVSQCGSRYCTGLRTWDPHAEEAREGFDHVEPADCSVCGGSIPTTATERLCGSCRATAKATAEAFPGGPERFTHTRKTR